MLLHWFLEDLHFGECGYYEKERGEKKHLPERGKMDEKEQLQN
jgi:hypothetical protein